MTLQVPFEQFAATVGRVLGVRHAYLASHPSGSLATAAEAGRDTLIVAVATTPPEAARARLAEAGLEVFDGVWSVDGEVEFERDPLATATVAAVAYTSGDGTPGVWVDAFPEPPGHVQVLRAMHEEFVRTGEAADATFEAFVRIANPTVVTVSPEQMRTFLEGRKWPC